ncbi:MAG: hypothetical protein KAS32_27965 [Candidatus Peribacteraceae bacterium]|nr:hypothetical protein [Candidatus Peribacteraceae bacterium]
MAFGQVNKIVNYTWKFTGVDKANASMSRLAQTANIAVAAVVAGMAALTVSSVRVASAFTEVENQFNITFGDGAREARIELDRFADSVNRSGDRMLGFAAQIQSMLIPIGVTREAAAEMSVTAVQLATDLGSFWNESTQQVIQDMQSAFAGMSRPMRKYGKDVSAAAADVELLNMGIEGGFEAATNAEKAIARLNIMIAQSSMEMGDTFRTAGEFENQMRSLEDAWYDTRLEIGEGVIPILQEVIPEIETLMGDFKEFAVEIIPQVVDILINDLAPALLDLSGMLIEIAGLLTLVAEGWSKLFESAAVQDMNAIAEGMNRMRTIDILENFNVFEMQGQFEAGKATVLDFVDSLWDTSEVLGEINEEITTLGTTGDGDIDPPYIRTLKDGIKEVSNAWTRGHEMEMLALQAMEDKHIILTDALRAEEESAYRMQNIMSNAAADFGSILARGGEDWESQMLNAIARMALEFAQMQLGKAALGGLGGGVFSFLGGFL